MSVLDKLACRQGRRDDVLNQDLARDLAARRDLKAIREIAENLRNTDKNIRSDCIKVLYEIGYIDATLIAEHGETFIELLRSKDNRMVWGAMIALSTIAGLQAKELYRHVAKIKKTMATGSVITMDAGVKTLAAIAAGNGRRSQAIVSYLFDHLATCRPKEVAQHAESTVVAVNRVNRKDFVKVLQKRLEDLTPAQALRIKRVIKQVEQMG